MHSKKDDQELVLTDEFCEYGIHYRIYNRGVDGFDVLNYTNGISINVPQKKNSEKYKFSEILQLLRERLSKYYSQVSRKTFDIIYSGSLRQIMKNLEKADLVTA